MPSPAPTASPRMSRAVLVSIIAAVAVIALGITAVLLTRSSDSSSQKVSVGASTIEMGRIAVEGTALAAMPDGGAIDPAIGAVAPIIRGQGFDGTACEIVPGSGPMLVMFVAHWCPHCQREVPLVAKWLKNADLAGVTVKAIATGTNPDLPNYPPSAWLAGEQWTVPTLADDATTTAATAYGLTSFPYFVALDAAGHVVRRASGEITEGQFNELATLAKG